MTYNEMIEEERWKLRHFFTKKEIRSKLSKNPVTRASLIQRYHALHDLERYPFGVPSNLITPNQLVAIINQLNKSQ